MGNCPVARALMRATGTTSCAVGNVGMSSGGVAYYYPRSVTRFVQKFDHGKTVKPFRFILRPV